ncbi:MAG: helix-turn-helix domain-containing protein [Tannerella sp.]|jgi:DNA-binding IclR family transcriptional regulator|nr:helix-turn-helix domain-containing protein [Tannerella sp.]
MIQVINRALNILEYIASDSNREFGLSEIADTLELNHGTCANILKTLVQRNYVEQMAAKKGYKLGYMVYKLCDSDLYNEDLINILKEPLDKLGEELNEAIILSVIRNDKRILLYETIPNQELRVHAEKEASVYKASTGHIIIAHYSPKELNDMIKRIGLPNEDEWPCIKTKEDLICHFNKIRNDNIEIFCNKNHIVGLSTPLFKNNKVIASLGIYLPDARYGAAEKKTLPSLLKRTTAIINEKINSL